LPETQLLLEEAFSVEGLEKIPKTNEWPIPIDPQIMEIWGIRLPSNHVTGLDVTRAIHDSWSCKMGFLIS